MWRIAAIWCLHGEKTFRQAQRPSGKEVWTPTARPGRRIIGATMGSSGMGPEGRGGHRVFFQSL